MMYSGTSYTSDSNSDQVGSVNEQSLPIVQSQPMYGNMHAFTMLPQISGHPLYFPSLFCAGPPQGAYHPSLLGPAYGHVMPPNVFIILPNGPIIPPHFSFTSPQITGAPMYYPFPFQPVLPQITYQPSFSVGHMPQLNDPRMSSVAPYVPFPLHKEQPQIAYQLPVEPGLSCELGYNSFSNHVELAQSTSQPSLDPSFEKGQQPHDCSVPSRAQSAGLLPTSNIYNSISSSNCVEQPQSTYKPLLDLTFNEGQQLHDSTLPSQAQTVGLAPTRSIHLPSYPGKLQSTYQPSFDPAFCGEQTYDHNILYQAQGVGKEQSYTSREPNNDLGTTSEMYPFYPTIYSEEPQSTYLSPPAPDYTLESSGSQASSCAVNQDQSFCPNYPGPYSYELFNPLAAPDFQQKASPRGSYLIPSLKRAVDEIYSSGSKLDTSGQSATAPSFEDAPRPSKRLKEADIFSTSCVPEESLAVISNYGDLHNPETFSVDGCRISQDQRMNLPVQSDQLVDHCGKQNDASMLHGARNFRISGNPTFTNIGVNNVTNQSRAHDLEILTKFVSFDALHDSSVQDPNRRCHPGTRENVIARLQAWTDDPGASEHIVWLHGLPGAGKSSVAQTITRLCGREKVVATFFFYRSDPSRNDGNRLFTTIAWQLASSIPGVKTCLVDSLTRRPDLPMKDVETQFDELVVQPLHALNYDASHLDPSLAPVVVIDGVDECADENLQQRVLNVIGNAIGDHRVPLRFLILSRPEAHIKETVNQFKCPTLHIDLDSIDNANHDIERYFNAEFSRIGIERHFVRTWPGHRVIQLLVCNSSGQFVYAATVIKYVGDAYNCAKAQLDIILGLRRYSSASPFALLDDLYAEILKRQPDQDFLKNVLALFDACNSIDQGYNLYADFPTLLNVSKKEMRRKLRGMQSLLAFEELEDINVHHRSFLDFLQDMSRSGQYHVSERTSRRRYLELITETIVRYASEIIDQPQCHNTQHLRLEFLFESSWWISNPVTDVEDLGKVLQPLMDLLDKILNRLNFTSSMKVFSCDQCDFFEIIRNLLLQHALNQAKSRCITFSSTEPLTFEQEGDYSTISAFPKIEAEDSVSDNDLETQFASLLAYMRNIPLTSSPTVSALELMHLLLRFDCAKIAEKVCSVLDAQHLMDLIDYMIHDQNFVKNSGMNLMCKAVHLILEIYARIPVLPQSLPSYYENMPECGTCELDDDDLEIEYLCSKALMARVLNRHFISTHGLILDSRPLWADDNTRRTNSVRQWSRSSKASHRTMFYIVLELSKSIQYFHSNGAVLSCETILDFISLDSEFRPKFHIRCLGIKGLKNVHQYERADDTYENSVFTFGRLFYEMYFNIELPYCDRWALKRDIIVKRPSEPEIREDAWQLIQRCCAEDPDSRPTIDEVVQEMEYWGIESGIDTPGSLSSVDSDF